MKNIAILFTAVALLLLFVVGCYPDKGNEFYFLKIGNGKVPMELVTQQISFRTTTQTFYKGDRNDPYSFSGSYTHYEKIILTDTTTFPVEMYIKDDTNSRGEQIVIISKDSFFTKRILLYKDTNEKEIKVNFTFHDTVCSVSPVTLEEEYIINERNQIPSFYDLGKISRREIENTFSSEVFIISRNAHLKIDTVCFSYFYDTLGENICLYYPNPDKLSLSKLAYLKPGTLLHLWMFTVKSDALDVKRYYPSATMIVTE